MDEEQDKSTKDMRKERRSANIWMFGWFLVAVVVYRLSDDLLRLLMQAEAGRRLDEQAMALPDMGVAALQPLFLKVAYLLWGVGVSAILAGFMQTRMKVDAFGKLSRWAVLFCLFLLCYCLLGA